MAKEKDDGSMSTVGAIAGVIALLIGIVIAVYLATMAGDETTSTTYTGFEDYDGSTTGSQVWEYLFKGDDGAGLLKNLANKLRS